MSAPDTDISKQSRRHRPALWGMAAAVCFAAIAFVVYLALLADPDTSLVENDATVTQEAVAD